MVVGQDTELEKFYILDDNLISGTSTRVSTFPHEESIQVTVIRVLLNIALMLLSFVTFLIILVLSGVYISSNRWKQVATKNNPIILGIVISIGMYGIIAFNFEALANFRWLTGGCLQQYYKIVIGIVNLIFLSVLLLTTIILFQKGFKVLYTAIPSLIYIIFIVMWQPGFYFVIVGMGFAYPVTVSALLGFHIALFYITVVAIAVLYNQCPYFNRIKNTQATYLRLIAIFIIIFLILLMLPSSIVYVGAITLFGLIGAQGLVTSIGAQAAVILLPSIGLFVVSWLIKINFLGDSGKCMYACQYDYFF